LADELALLKSVEASGDASCKGLAKPDLGERGGESAYKVRQNYLGTACVCVCVRVWRGRGGPFAGVSDPCPLCIAFGPKDGKDAKFCM
jgi:hypothetical protein